jgi:hypothetical protein
MDAKTIEILFERFSLIWGNKWDTIEAKHPELIADEWREALAGLSRQAIKQGLSKTRQTLTWPPTIAEFLQACQGVEIVQDVNHFMCNIPGCPNPGTMCRATHGNNWICNKHYHEGKG